MTFRPLAAGARSAQVVIISSDPVNPTLTVTLSGGPQHGCDEHASRHLLGRLQRQRVGLGELNPAQPTGLIVPGANLPALVYPVTVSVGGQPATVVYQGAASLEVAGVYQVNCTVPPGLAAGQAAIVVTADGKPSQTNLFVMIK